MDESENQKAGFSASLGRRKGKIPPSLPQSNPTKATPFGGVATLGRIKKNSENIYSSEEKSPPSFTKASNRSPMAASLDRKYLRFLRVAPEKQPVPTPQFRSYRKPSPSPSHSPTTIAAPALPPSPYWMDSPKPPPRPPNESKPASPFKPQPSSPAAKDLKESNGSSFDFASHMSSKASRHSAERAAQPSNPIDAINTFRKSISTSKLPITHSQQINPCIVSEGNTLTELHELEKDVNTPLPHTSNRRHSIEIIDAKFTKSPIKPKLAPKPNTARILPKSGGESNSVDVQRRVMYGSLNRSGCNDADMFGNQESGYAKIKPRNASSAGDYVRSNSIGSSGTLSSNRTECVVRRSSVSSSRRSSTDGGAKTCGTSSSLSKLPSPNTSLSPTSPSRGIFDFSVDSFGYALFLILNLTCDLGCLTLR